MQQVAGKDWKIVSDTQLLAGQDSHISLRADGTACVEKIELTNNKDKDVDVSFKPASGDGDKEKKDTLDLAVSLKKVQPGGYSLAIQQYGASEKSNVPLTAYTGDIHVDGVKIHNGDHNAILSGQGLKDVVSVQIAGQTFMPSGDGNDDKTVHLEAKLGVSPADGSEASVKLKDGRTMTAKVSTEAARPGLQLLSFNDAPAKQDGVLPVTLGAKNDIPLNGKLTFVVQTKDAFPRTQTIEVATADGSVHTSLSLATNDLVLQDEHTAIATLDPLKAFGQSAFGKLQMRPVAADGTPGDWTPLGILVRTPQITAIRCTTAAYATCTAEGSNLFLVQSFGAGKDFANPAAVPTGFAESTFKVPTPADGTTVYLKLRDDPESVASIALPTPLPKPAVASSPDAPGPAAAATPPADTASSPASPVAEPPPPAQIPPDTPDTTAKPATPSEQPAADAPVQPK